MEAPINDSGDCRLVSFIDCLEYPPLPIPFFLAFCRLLEQSWYIHLRERPFFRLPLNKRSLLATIGRSHN